MSRSMPTHWAVVTLTGLVWNSVSAQEATTPLRPEGGESARLMYIELRSLQDRMGRLGNLALEGSAELAERWQSLQGVLKRAMVEIDPGAGDDLGRLEGTWGELEESWADRDMNRVERLLDERRQLGARLRSVQAEALRREDVAAEVTAFRTALLARLRKGDPQLDALMDRMGSLAEELRSLEPAGPVSPDSRETGGAREPQDRE